MDELVHKKQLLKDKQSDQQDINKRLSEFQKVISKHEVLKKFDRHVFESIVDRVIVGEKAENGEINPYKLKFIFKTGYEKDEVASEQPFSFGNSCSHTNSDCDIISLQGDDGACRVCGCTTSGRYVRILDFRHFERHMMFSQSDRKTYKKAISDGVNVSVVLDVGCGNT